MPEPTNANNNPQPNNNGGEGGNGNQNPQPNQNQNQNPQGGGAGPDLSKLTEADLAKVLENENLWKQPRLAELLNASKELKNLKTQQEQKTEQELQEQNKHKELAESYKGKLDQATQTITQLRQDQALTNVLVKAGVVDLDAALKLVDRGKLTMDDATGQITGADQALEALKSERSYLFTNQGGGNNPQLGTPTNNGQGNNQNPGNTQFKFKRSQLKDPAFYAANRDEIVKAMQAGLIEDDLH